MAKPILALGPGFWWPVLGVTNGESGDEWLSERTEKVHFLGEAV